MECQASCPSALLRLCSSLHGLSGAQLQQRVNKYVSVIFQRTEVCSASFAVFHSLPLLLSMNVIASYQRRGTFLIRMTSLVLFSLNFFRCLLPSVFV